MIIGSKCWLNSTGGGTESRLVVSFDRLVIKPTQVLQYNREKGREILGTDVVCAYMETGGKMKHPNPHVQVCKEGNKTKSMVQVEIITAEECDKVYWLLVYTKI